MLAGYRERSSYCYVPGGGIRETGPSVVGARSPHVAIVADIAVHADSVRRPLQAALTTAIVLLLLLTRGGRPSARSDRSRIHQARVDPSTAA